MTMLKGQELIQHHDNNSAKPLSQRVIDAGYIRANGKPNFTDYYTELVEAKNAHKKWMWQDKVQCMMHFVNEYCDEKYVPSDMFSAYYDLVQQYDVDVVDAFCHTYSVEDVESFEDSFQGIYDSEAKFAEEFVDSMGENLPHYIVVDYDATWWQSLRHDYTYDADTCAVFCDNF
jgi:antirestriction protein